jgi:hypothetical protein
VKSKHEVFSLNVELLRTNIVETCISYKNNMCYKLI